MTARSETACPRMEPDLVLGTAQLVSSYGIVRDSVSSRRTAQELLEHSMKLGVAALDTAPSYGDAEDVIGATQLEIPIHTKIEPGVSPEDSLSRSLARLRRTRVDVLYLHDSTEILQRDSSVVAAAAQLVGPRVANLGASVYDDEEFDAAVADPRVTVVQVPVNLFDRRFCGCRLQRAVAAGKRIYARSALLQGVLVADPGTLPDAVQGLRPFVSTFQHIAAVLGRSPLDAALAWVRQVEGVRGVVIGAATVDELTEVVAMFRTPPLRADEAAALQGCELPDRVLTDPRRWVPAQ